MRRLVDLLLIAALLGAAGVGAYLIGHRVDHLSNQASSQDSELNGTTTVSGTHTGATHTHRIFGSHVTPLLVGAAVLAALAALVLAWLVNALVKSRRRQRWRLSS
jgi:Uncharacterized protein conserved in bacteria (DUF2062)